MSDLLYHKIIKDHEEILMAKIVLPLCTQLGLRGKHPALLYKLPIVNVYVLICSKSVHE